MRAVSKDLVTLYMPVFEIETRMCFIKNTPSFTLKTYTF